MNKEKLISLSSSICNVELDISQAEAFEEYAMQLIETNKVMNLTAVCDEDGILYRHFIDSLTIFKTGLITGRIIDVGTGAGFPGMVMKIAHPELEVTLFDSLAKRLNFLLNVANSVNLNVNIEHGRAEDGGHNPKLRENFDIATARAVARLSVLCEYCLPFVKIGGYFIAIKGPKAEEELKESANAIQKLGGELVDVLKVNIPYVDTQNHIVIVKKIGPTPKIYPRNPAAIKKKSL